MLQGNRKVGVPDPQKVLGVAMFFSSIDGLRPVLNAAAGSKNISAEGNIGERGEELGQMATGV